MSNNERRKIEIETSILRLTIEKNDLMKMAKDRGVWIDSFIKTLRHELSRGLSSPSKP
jgi:hypothetical protein